MGDKSKYSKSLPDAKSADFSKDNELTLWGEPAKTTYIQIRAISLTKYVYVFHIRRISVSKERSGGSYYRWQFNRHVAHPAKYAAKLEKYYEKEPLHRSFYRYPFQFGRIFILNRDPAGQYLDAAPSSLLVSRHHPLILLDLCSQVSGHQVTRGGGGVGSRTPLLSGGHCNRYIGRTTLTTSSYPHSSVMRKKVCRPTVVWT